MRAIPSSRLGPSCSTTATPQPSSTPATSQDVTPVHRIPCPFCGQILDDPMLGWWRHLDANPACKAQYRPWREYVRQDAGEV